MLWPLPASNRDITTHHGDVLYNSAGEPYFHIGLDISAEVGTPVFATQRGIAHREYTNAGGNVMRIAGQDYYTRSCHLSEYSVNDGEQVDAGQEIARSGNTGSATTGAHLHFEVHLPNGVPVDPLFVMEVPKLGKLSLHFQETRDWTASVTAKYWDYRVNPASWVKAINPPAPDIFPHTHVLGRSFWHAKNNDWEGQCVARGHAGGEDYFAYLLPYYQERRGMVTAWEAANEPALGSVQQAYNYVDFLNTWGARMRNAGFKTCGGSIAVGNPQLQVFNDPLGNQILTIILPALVQCDYWSYHAYWDGRYNPADNWWAHRYREIVKVAAELGYKLPPLIISECGCDHGGGKLDGWRARMGWAEHWADVQAFSKEIAKDSYVVAATLFTSAPNNDWTYFEYDQAQAETIGKQRLGEPVADIPATPAPTQAEIEKALGDEMQQHIIPLNPNAALERAMSVYGLLPASGEFDVSFGGQTYRCQGARQAGEREWQYIVYAVKDAWDSVHIFKRAN